MGFAIDNKTRDQQLAWVKELGATVIRSHYPLAPYTQERADELGIMQWSEIPVYSVKTQYLKQKLVRELAARELESNIQTNGNHPSVIIWSIANELSARPGPVQGALHQGRGRARARARPVAARSASPPPATRRPAASPSTGRSTSSASTTTSAGTPAPTARSPTARCSPTTWTRCASAIPTRRSWSASSAPRPTATGRWRRRAPTPSSRTSSTTTSASSRRSRGCRAPSTSRCRSSACAPTGTAATRGPQPPIHQKGLVSFDGVRKPAFFDVQRIFLATKQFRAVPRSGL